MRRAECGDKNRERSAESGDKNIERSAESGVQRYIKPENVVLRVKCEDKITENGDSAAMQSPLSELRSPLYA